MPKKPKKRRLVKGKDYTGWGLKDRHTGILIMTCRWLRLPRAKVWSGHQQVRVKLVEVEP